MKDNIWKFLPCSTYDIEKIETFLNDMSKEGYNLQKEGIFFNVAYFEKGKQRYYYHLVPKIRKNNDETTFMLQQEQNGYLYLDTIGDFYIYAHIKPFEIEVNQKVYKELKQSVPSSLFGSFLTIILFILFDIETTFLLFVITCGSFQSLVMFVLFIIWLIRKLNKYFIYNDTYKKYLNQSRREEKAWYNGRFLFPFYEFFKIATVIILAFSIIIRLNPENKKLPENVSQIPFATLSDFVKDDLSYSRDDTMLFGGYTTFFDVLAPVNYEWEETGDFVSIYPTNMPNFALLDAYYHETIHPIIASQLVREHTYRNLHNEYYDYVEVAVDAKEYGLDELRVLTNRHHCVYIMRLDKEVLCFDLNWDSSEHQMENIIPILKQSLEC